METMKAALVRQFGQPLTIEEIRRPAPGPNEVLIKIEACGVCHTDLHAMRGDWPVKPTLPFVPGHEGVGIVVERGRDVTHLLEGQRVGVAWLHSSCGQCDYCLTGWETLCLSQEVSGYTVDGCFADYTLAHASHATPIPESLDAGKAAPLLCAGVTTYKGLKRTEVRPGQWVVISGVGGLGHMAVQYAKAMGMYVAAVDIKEDKLELARNVGADLTVNASTEDAVATIVREIGGAHGVLVAAVSSKAFGASVRMLRRGGTCVLIGLPPGDFPTPIFDVVFNGLTIRGSIVGTRFDLTEALAFAVSNTVDARIEYQPLEAINDVFDRLQNGRVDGRVVLDFTGTASAPRPLAAAARA
jgi:propanol-preferring alcohol dehydrogenase